VQFRYQELAFLRRSECWSTSYSIDYLCFCLRFSAANQDYCLWRHHWFHVYQSGLL